MSAPMGGAVIEARALGKRYGAAVAVDGIDLALQPGEIFGLLGPNGAGKTTTILMVLGLTDPTAGTVRVLGFDPAREPLEVKRRVGYLPDAVGFYDAMTARQNLRYTARLLGLERDEAESRIREALHRVGLGDVGDHRVGTYSRGMRQRLGLAEIRMKRAEIAILDEPTSALDPQATDEMLDMIRDLKADGVTVLLSSHLLDQVQRVCDRVALFHLGRIALLGTVAELADQVLGGEHALIVEAEGDNLQALLEGTPGAKRVVREAHGFRVYAERDIRGELAARVATSGARLLRLNPAEHSLDEIYRRYFEGVRHAA
jgi:ABC-2 type transport system ATP-binding protein